MRHGIGEILAACIQPQSAMVSILKSGSQLYIRQPYNATHDTVRSIAAGVPQSITESGVVDFHGVRLIPIATINENMGTAFIVANATTEYLAGGGDESPPEKFNGMYLAGGHGVASSYKLTKVGHGLTGANVGEVGNDGAAKPWVLTRIIDADNISVTARPTGTATKWIINGTMTGNDLSFPSGTFTATTKLSQLFLPLVQRYTLSISVDGDTVTADGAYSGRDILLSESYGIPNPAAWMTTLQAEAGSSTPKLPSHTDIQTQIEIAINWHFGGNGERVGVFSHYNVQQYGRSGGGTDDYYGAMQSQTLYKTAGNTLHQYIPDVSPVGVYDFKAIADISANSATVTIPRTSCADTSNPASHFVQLVKNGSAVPRFGYVAGYARHYGVGIPAARASILNVMQLSSSEKQYFHAVDSGMGTTAAAGLQTDVMTYDAYYDMSGHPTYTVNKIIEYPDGTAHWIIDIHATVNNVDIAIPEYYIGKTATVIDKSASFTLNTSTVAESGLNVSVSGGYGRAVVQISS